MKLREIVIEDAILPNLEAENRDAAIDELMSALVNAGAVDPERKDDFIAAVIQREQRASTGLGHGVAVPHVKHDAVDTLKVAIGVSHGGVDFNALDRRPVYSIFMLLSPTDRPEDHLDAMQVIFKNLGEDTFRRFLRQATTVEEVLTLLSEADDTQMVP